MQQGLEMIHEMPRSPAARLVDGASSRAGYAVDSALVRTLLALGRRARRRGIELPQRRAYYDAIAEMYAPHRERFYAPPPALEAIDARPVRALPDGGFVSDARWASDYEPLLPLGRAELERWPECRTAHTRMLLHRDPRPAVVCIHGYRCGGALLEQWVWRARWLYQLGLDVVLFTLPHHGRRAPTWLRRIAPFPSHGNMIRTNEGFGQTIWDLRRLHGWLRRRGAPSVGAAGFSLGGYVAALWATVEPQLNYALLALPLADLTDCLADAEARRGVVLDEDTRRSHLRSLDIHRPLGRAPQIDPASVLVLEAAGDVVTGRRHARALAGHFRAPLVQVPGSHFAQVGRNRAFTAIEAHLRRHALA